MLQGYRLPKRLFALVLIAVSLPAWSASTSNSEWIDSIGVVALFEQLNGAQPDISSMLLSKTMSKSYKLPSHLALTKSKRKYPRDEFGLKQYAQAYKNFYFEERDRLSEAESFLIPVAVNLGAYNFGLGAYTPSIKIDKTPGDGSYICGSTQARGSTGLLVCMRVLSLRSGADAFQLLEMPEEQATELRRSKVGYSLRVVPVQEEFMDLDVEIKRVGMVKAMLNVRAVELLAYDRETRKTLYHKAAPDYVGISSKSKPAKGAENVDSLDVVPAEPVIEIELPK